MHLARHLAFSLTLFVGFATHAALVPATNAHSVAGGVPVNAPGPGGAVPTQASGLRASSSAALAVVTPGLVLASGGDGVGGIQLTVWMPDGTPVATALSGKDGAFDLVTPVGAELWLTVLGVSVPFWPGEPLVIVLP